MDSKTLAKIIAKSIFYASIQSSLGSVEMSSKFSVVNFSKDQLTLDRAAEALRSYIIIGCVWTLGTVLTLYASHGWCGAWIGFAINMVMMGWIVISYMNAFKAAAKNYSLVEPKIMRPGDGWLIAIGSVLTVLCGLYGGDALRKIGVVKN